MGRWQPNPEGRLQVAAMELYGERGFEQTTVAEIAQRAGLTERTFFRYFSDKREVLFAGAPHLQARLVGAVAAAPASVPPLAAVTEALERVAVDFEPNRAYSQQRQAVVMANTGLIERELTKMSVLAAALTEALRVRGVGEPMAGLVAETGIAIFKVAFERWVEPSNEALFVEIVRESVAALRAATAL